MSKEIFESEATLKVAVGHLLVIWDVLANKASGSQFLDQLTEEEKRAIWALQDLCESELAGIGMKPLPESEWNKLMCRARDFVRTIPVEFLDE